MSAVVAAARAALGARFRLHGREPDDGLDCVGLVAFAYRAVRITVPMPTGYALHSGDAAWVAAVVEALGLTRADEPQAGDLLLCEGGPGQLHLVIDSGTGIIHADAMLRRVVERPGQIPWPVIGRWRLAKKEE